MVKWMFSIASVAAASLLVSAALPVLRADDGDGPDRVGNRGRGPREQLRLPAPQDSARDSNPFFRRDRQDGDRPAPRAEQADRNRAARPAAPPAPAALGQPGQPGRPLIALLSQLNLTDKQVQEIRRAVTEMFKQRVTEFIGGADGKVLPLREQLRKALQPILSREQNQKVNELLSHNPQPQMRAEAGKPPMPGPFGRQPGRTDDGQRPQLRGQGRDGFPPQWGPRDAQRPQWGGQNRDGFRPQFGQRDGQRPQWGGQNRDGFRPQFGQRNAQRPQWGGQNRDGFRPQFGQRNGQRPQWGNQGRDGFRPQFGQRNGQRNGQRDGQRPQWGGQNRDGFRPQMRGPGDRSEMPAPQAAPPRPEIRQPRGERQAGPAQGAESSLRVARLIEQYQQAIRSAGPEDAKKLQAKLAHDIETVLSAKGAPAALGGEKPTTERRPEAGKAAPVPDGSRGDGRPGFGGPRFGPGQDGGRPGPGDDGGRPMRRRPMNEDI